jgi:hypothetical protein
VLPETGGVSTAEVRRTLTSPRLPRYFRPRFAQDGGGCIGGG